MPNEEQRVTEHLPSRVICDWTNLAEDRVENVAGYEHASRMASNEAAEREQAYVRALNRPASPAPMLPIPKAPVLPDDFWQRLTALDEATCRKGVAVSRDKLLALGRERFEELLQSDRAARHLSRIITTLPDLSSWASVRQHFGMSGVLQTLIRARSDSEIIAGAGKDRERAARISGFEDLWKAAPEPQDVRHILAFRNVFEGLCFGVSLLDRIGSDGRVRSHLFVGGSGAKVAYFDEWTSVLQGSHFKVMLVDPLFQLLAWLANEKTPLVEPLDWAKETFGLRAPARAEVELGEAVTEAFVLGHSGWSLWDFVGRQTRQAINEERLDGWRNELARRYPAIQCFHEQCSAAFVRPVSEAGSSYWQRDDQSYRTFIERTVRTLSNQLSAVTALAIDETCPGTLAARFADWLLCEGGRKPKSVPTSERIERRLCEAFPGSRFRVEIEPA